MKKFLLSLIALLGVGTYALADEASVADVQIKQGKSATIEIKFDITSDDVYRDFQFDLYLPDGITIQTDADGYYAATVGDACSAHSLGSNKQSDGAIRFVGNNNDGRALKTGVLVSIPVDADASLEVGRKLTGEIKTFFISKENGEQPSFDLTFNIEIVEDLITLYDTETEAPAAATGQNVKVVRALKAEQWNTICLPFAVADPEAVFGEGVQVADFTGCEATYASDEDKTAQSIKVNFSSVTEMEANHPYIIKVKENLTDFTANGVDIVTATVDDLTLALDETKISRTVYHYNYFIGTYVAGTPVEAGSVIISGNKFYVTKGTTIKAFRGYFFFEVDQIADMIDSGISLVKMSLDDDATAIENIDVDVNAEGWYDLSGRKLDKKPSVKGIYINNGKKQLVK